jgi:hypothetical protein
MIRLKSLLEGETNYKIYCDMDGVLVDFKTGWENFMGDKLGAPLIGAARTEFWKRFRNKIKEKGTTETDFWAELPWMKDGKALWSYIRPHSPTILSAPTVNPESKVGKKIWLKNKVGSVPAILDYDKSKYATPNSILIDDRKDFIDKWVASGGIGILHKNTSQTIKQLKDLGIE